jgi:DNA-binding MarR family transcriptional regulator
VTVRNRFLALVCLLSSLSLFADIEILYFTKPNELIVESATLFNREKKSDNKGNNNGEETKYETVYAFCGEIADDCNRKTAKKIIKIVDYDKYIERLAKATGVRVDFMKRGKIGAKLFEKTYQAAKEQNKGEYLQNLEVQKREITKNQEIFPFLDEGLEKKISSGSEPFMRALMPLEAEPMLTEGKDKNSHFELLSGQLWRLGSDKEMTYSDAKEVCNGIDAKLPSVNDFERTKKWLAESPVASWAKSFWLDNTNGEMDYKSVKVPYEGQPNTTIQKTQQTYKVSIYYSQFKGGESVLSTEVFSIDLGFSGENPLRQQPKVSDYLNKIDEKKSVVCIKANKK